MDPQRITHLAKLLRTNGDRILNSEFTLTLSGPLICALNDSFTIIADSQEIGDNQNFQVLKTLNFKSAVFRDLQLIHDFVQKTPLLCITQYPGDGQFDVRIDISKFHALKQLKLDKINVQRVYGIQHLRPQIQELICTKCLKSIDEILQSCGGDNSNGLVWNELQMADFSYNNLQTIITSLEFAQNLQYLHLQHNRLESIEAVKWLPHLKSLNVSYNRLQQIPQFHSNCCKTLQILIMNNNLIENLNGINRLDALNDLDLGDNYLLSHNALLPISVLITLKFLNLTGNPLYYHPKHRSMAVMYLHKNCSDVKFVLDSNMLTKSERNLTGKRHMRQMNMMHDYILSTSTSTSTVNVAQSSNGCESASSSVTSLSFNLPNNPKKHSGKAYKPRKVVISDSSLKTCGINARNSKASDANTVNSDATTLAVSDRMKNSYLEEEEEHSKTKFLIENFREKYGNEWLLADNAEKLTNVLGVPSYSTDTPAQYKVDANSIYDDIFNPTDRNISLQNSTPTNTALEGINEKEVMMTTASTTAVTPTTIDLINDFNPALQEIAYESSEEEILIDNEDSNNSKSDSVANEELSEAESDEEIYLVTAANNQQATLLTKSINYLREKDPITKRTITKWNLNILESCDRLKSNMLRINFDTVKLSKQERRYIIEENICQDLEKKLRSILSKRLLCEMHQNVYHCVNCSCQFSIEVKYPNEDLKINCPNCKSTFVAKSNALEDSLETVGNQQTSILSSHSSLIEKLSKTEAIPTDIIEDYKEENLGKAGENRENPDNTFDAELNQIKDKQVVETTNSEKDIASSVELGISKVSISSTTDGKSQPEQQINSTITSTVTKETTGVMLTKALDVSSSPSVSDSNSTSVSVKDNLNNSGNSFANISSSYDDKANLTNNSLIKFEQNHNSDSLELQNNGLKATTQEIFKFNYVDYNDVDHRLKLYFYQMKFSENNEHFKYIVRGRMFCMNSTSATSSFMGLLIVSTHKCYLMEAFAPENHNISKWLREVFSCPINDLLQIQMLPWNVGFQIDLNAWGGFLLLLPHRQYTDNLLLYLKSIAWPHHYQLLENANEHVLNYLTVAVPAEEQLELFVILNSCEISCEAAKRLIAPCSLLITDHHLYVSSENLHWMLFPNTIDNIELCCIQLLSNVVEVTVEHSSNQQINITFLDEDHNKYEYWKCRFDSVENTTCCLRVLDQSWQQIFGVSLFNT